MDKIKLSDLQILNGYGFIENGFNKQNKNLIGLKWIKQKDKWTQQLVEIKRADVSCWSIFLSIFGLGTLAYTTLSLNQICDYLCQYNWKKIKIEEFQHAGTSNYKAFLTICHLANRHMQRYNKFQLFKEVSEPITSDFNHYWNPAMNGRTLLSLQHYLLPDAVGIELRFKDSKMPVLAHQRLTKHEVAKTEVGYMYEQTKRVKYYDTYNYHYYPNRPYYQALIRSSWRTRKQEI